MSIFEKFKVGFKKSAENISSGLKEILLKKEIDDVSLNEIEEFLISSDVGLDAASEIRNILSQEKIDPNLDIVGEINKILKKYIISTMLPFERKDFFKKKKRSKCYFGSRCKWIWKNNNNWKNFKNFKEQ